MVCGGFIIGTRGAFCALVLAVGAGVSPAPAAPAATASAAAVGRAVGSTVVVGGTIAVLVVIVFVVVAAIEVGTGAAGPGIGTNSAIDVDHHRLRSDEQRHVGRNLGSCRRRGGGLHDDHPGVGRDHPGVGLLGTGVGLLGTGVGAQQFPNPQRLVLVDAGLRATGAPVDLGEGIEHPLAGGAQRTCQRVNPQPFGKVRIGRRLPLQTTVGQAAVGQILVANIRGEIVIGHVGSSSPRARHVDAATRGLRCRPGRLPGLVCLWCE